MPLQAKASKAAESLYFEDFQSQVVAFLSPEAAAQYAHPSEWESIQLRVLEFLEQLR